MLHFGWFDIRTDLLVLLVSVLLIALQLVLCFRVKNVWLRLSPCLLWTTVSVILVILSFFLDDWDRFGFLFLALCSAILLCMCGIAWGIWAVVKRILRKKEGKEQ